jgi:hypothetical protein
LFWPGPDGAETSGRFEVFREAVQEVEARIFIEQAVEKLNDPELTKEATAFLESRIHDTLHLLVFAPHYKLEEFYSGWQVRSRRLYNLAAVLARRISTDFRQNEINIKVPARGRIKTDITLRSWRLGKQDWTLSTESGWIKPETASGKSPEGQTRVRLVLDASKLKPGETAEGLLTLKSASTGSTDSLKIKARVSDVYRVLSREQTLNMTCGEKIIHPMTLLNESGSSLDWKITASEPWVRITPAGGILGPGKQVGVDVQFAPPDKTRTRHGVKLTVTETGGITLTKDYTIHVIPAYAAPAGLPEGTPHDFESVYKKERVVEKIRRGRKANERDRRISFFAKDDGSYQAQRGGLQVGKKKGKDKHNRVIDIPIKKFEKGFVSDIEDDVTYSVEGENFSAFSCEVGACFLSRGTYNDPRVSFEIYVDGKFRTGTNLMKFSDAPRLLVVDKLENAKTIKLVSRLNRERKTFGSGMRIWGIWGEPKFYKR